MLTIRQSNATETDNSRRAFVLLIGAVLIILWVISLNAYDSLPSRIPVHFNWDGTANRWSDKTPMHFFMLPATATLLSILLIFLSRFPGLYNFPQKEEVKNWPAEKRQPVYNLLNRLIYLIALLISGIFLLIQIEIIRAAKLQKTTPAEMWPLWILVALIIIMPIYYMIRINRLVRELRKTINKPISGS
jgi:uncharacterized membrane protein